MPRLKRSPVEAQNIEIAARIKYSAVKRAVALNELALAARITRSTPYLRIKNPGDFRLEELRLIALELGVTVLYLLGDGKAEFSEMNT